MCWFGTQYPNWPICLKGNLKGQTKIRTLIIEICFRHFQKLRSSGKNAICRFSTPCAFFPTLIYGLSKCVLSHNFENKIFEFLQLLLKWRNWRRILLQFPTLTTRFSYALKNLQTWIENPRETTVFHFFPWFWFLFRWQEKGLPFGK